MSVHMFPCRHVLVESGRGLHLFSAGVEVQLAFTLHIKQWTGRNNDVVVAVKSETSTPARVMLGGMLQGIL